MQRAARHRGLDLQTVSVEPLDRAALFIAQNIDLVLDVGGAVGRYGLTLRKEGYAGGIVSFEPLGQSFHRLEAVAGPDPLWEVRQLALGASPGRREIHVAGNSDSSSLLDMEERHLRSAPESLYVGSETVEVETLDAIWSEVAGAASKPFLKLDVQGFELEVLKGGRRSLTEVWGLQTEMSLVPLYARGPVWTDVIDYLRDAGFNLVALEPGHADPESREVLQVDGIFSPIHAG